MYPGAQICVEVDWSSGHSKHRDDALNVNAMSVNFGGKQPTPHASMMVDGCLGEGSTLALGELQYFYFRSAVERGDGQPDPPPFYKPDLAPSEYIGLPKGKKQVHCKTGSCPLCSREPSPHL